MRHALSIVAVSPETAGHSDNRHENGERRGGQKPDPTQGFTQHRHHRLLLLIKGAPAI